jgi:hypothetical protein
MRLINTTSGHLVEFVAGNLPRYAILSHTWGEDEISLQEYRKVTNHFGSNDPEILAATTKAGYEKIRNCTALAASQNIRYAWVDTCCIDKTSSAELSEAINSMFSWYQNACVCYVYLVDIDPSHGNDIRPSRWFTRGWTLQELIAPLDVQFYNRFWTFLGTKDSSLTAGISNITGIPREVLLSANPFGASVAQRMSWASKRMTTRVEDLAYSLLGIFQVHMTLLYGEGENAFRRLQEHIATHSTDHTLYAWGQRHGDSHNRISQPQEQSDWSFQNIFARSPSKFSRCLNVVEEEFQPVRPWIVTNRGLNVILPTFSALEAKNMLFNAAHYPSAAGENDFLVILNCSDVLDTLLGVWITKIDHRLDDSARYVRSLDYTVRVWKAQVQRLLEISQNQRHFSLWLSNSSSPKVAPSYFSPRIRGFRLERMGSRIESTMAIHYVYPFLNHSDRAVFCPPLPLHKQGGLVGVLTVTINDTQLAVAFGYPPDTEQPFAIITDQFNTHSPLELDLDNYRSYFGGQHQAFQIHSDDRGRYRDVTLILRSVITDEKLFTSLQIIPPEIVRRNSVYDQVYTY